MYGHHMRILPQTDDDLKKWISLTRDMENCVVSGNSLVESTPRLKLDDEAFIIITKPAPMAYRCIRDHTNKCIRGTRFVQFRTYKVDLGGFGGRRLYVTKVIISKHPRNPAMDLQTVGWMKSDTMRLAVEDIKKVLEGNGELVSDPD